MSNVSKIDNKNDVTEFRAVPVTRETWPAFEAFFAGHGRLNYCWCMPWRETKEERKTDTSSASRKGFMQQRIGLGVPVGFLLFANDTPIAWCSVAPKTTHLHLGGNRELEDVWSLTCMFIDSTYRRQGVTHRLIQEAQSYARANGAKYLEAYPVDRDSPSYRAMGFRDIFEEEGFEFTGKEGTRRNVMIVSLGER